MKTHILAIVILLAAKTTDAQNVGIGTNNPTYPLTVVASGSKGIIQKSGDVEVGFWTNSNSAYLQTWSNHSLNFSANNGFAHLTIAPSGNVGIGNTTPTARLDINGTLRMRGGNPSAGYVLTAIDANGNTEWKAPASGGGVKKLNIGYAAFTPSISSMGWSNLATLGRFSTTAPAGLMAFEAPLLLPAGTKLISIEWLVVDNHYTKDFELRLFKDDNYSAVDPSNSVVVISTTASTGQSAVAQEIFKSLNNHIMDNTPYILQAMVTDWPNTTQMNIKGVRITYE